MEFGLPVFINREANRGPDFCSSNDFHVPFTNHTCHVGQRVPSVPTGQVRVQPDPLFELSWIQPSDLTSDGLKSLQTLSGTVPSDQSCQVGRGVSSPWKQVRCPTRPVISALLNGTVGSHIGWSRLATELYMMQFPWSRLARLDKGYHPHRTGPWSNSARYLCAAE